ncbi:hypothetical protein [Phaeobacter sp. JH57H2]|uniref:hypothetical protein n=1 Tax=Phaeobacter sp. JH57H2 TaxID=1454808 RepID=UPI003A8991CC
MSDLLRHFVAQTGIQVKGSFQVKLRRSAEFPTSHRLEASHRENLNTWNDLLF